jgi:ferredoxin
LEVEKEPGTDDHEHSPQSERIAHPPAEVEHAVSDDVSQPDTAPEGGLPVEPPLVWEASGVGAAEEGYDAASVLRDLANFHIFLQRKPDDAPASGEPRPAPALLHQYRDFSQVRHDYPLCLTGRAPGKTAISLTQIFDDLLAEIADDTDKGRRLSRHLYRLEAEIRSLAQSGAVSTLFKLWTRAAKKLASSSKLSEEKKDTLRENLKTARKALKGDGKVIPCDAKTPDLLFEAVAVNYWGERCAPWRSELDTLIQNTENILSAEFSRSEEARKPDHLRASAGTDAEMDYQKMSTILGESQLENPMPESRRERIQRVLDTLHRVRPVFEDNGMQKQNDGVMPFDMRSIANDCTKAMEQYRVRMHTMLDFFKSVRIARLEIANGYREAIHDEYFAHFDTTYLTEDELPLCPPVLLKLDGAFFARGDVKTLMEILGTGIPFKVLVRLDDVHSVENESGDISMGLSWPARLATMAMALSDVFVLQSPISQPAHIQAGVLEGFRYEGAALFCVCTGNVKHHPELPVYLHAAAATESRVFPALRFNPGKGPTQAERINVLENPQSDREWPTEPFAFRTADGGDSTVNLSFTPADFFHADIRFERHFWQVPAAKWHPDMVTLTEYLQMEPEIASTRIPYLTTVDARGRVGRTVITRPVLTAMRRYGAFWRNLQEQGGINNSFALKRLAEEKARLEEIKERDVAALEEKYAANLEQDIGELTQEIVRRIAAQLMGNGSGALVVPSSPPAGAASAPPAVDTPAPVAEEPAAVKEEVEEEEAITFDDPYIDTPLCTSCNECTNLNAKMFAYNENKQAFIKDLKAGTYRDLVISAEKCPVKIIHPGKPNNPNEPNLEELVERAARFM